MTSELLADYLRRIRECDDARGLAVLRAELDRDRRHDPDARWITTMATVKRLRLQRGN